MKAWQPVQMAALITDRVRVGAWVAERVGRDSPWETEAALGLEKDGQIVAGIVLDGYVEQARASMHCAGTGRHWLTRGFLFACFDYAFRQLDLKALINPVAASNFDSLRFTKHIGFSEIARIPLAWDGRDDLVLFQMTRAECKWLRLGDAK